jgi:hypothetical protein
MPDYFGIPKGSNICSQRRYQFRQARILRILIGRLILAFKLYAYRKIIAANPTCITGFARMPGAPIYRNILYKLSVSAYQEVCRHLHSCYFLKIAVPRRVEAIRKQLVYPRPPKLPRWQ